MELVRQGVALAPDALLSHWTHGLVAHWAGAHDEAIAAFAHAKQVSGHIFAVSHAIVALANMGRLAEARAEYDLLPALALRRFLPKITIAVAAAAVGLQDQAMELAQESCDEREPTLLIMAQDFPDSIRLRQDPRFAEIRRRMGLTPVAP